MIAKKENRKLQLGRGCNFVFRSGSELLINICSYNYTPNKKCLDFKMKRTFRLAELSNELYGPFPRYPSF